MIDSSFTSPKFLSEQECESIIQSCLEKKELEIATVNVRGNYEVFEEARKSKVSFFPYTPDYDWLLNRIKDFLNKHIKLKGYDFNFEVNFQFTHYGQGEHYGWHQDDSNEGPAADRVCSIVIQLSDDYEGGYLQYKKNGVNTYPKQRGHMHIFPSNWAHQVTPVTKGTRYSLVSWFGLTKQVDYKSTLL